MFKLFFLFCHRSLLLFQCFSVQILSSYPLLSSELKDNEIKIKLFKSLIINTIFSDFMTQ